MAIVLLMLPATAVAKRGYFFLPRETEVQLGVRASNGYKIRVTATRVGDRHRAQVVVGRGGTVATYRVPARIRRTMLRVNLGAFGRIDLRFHAREREAEESQPGCFGRPPTAETGFFDGHLRFRGEDGYTSVSATRAHGEVWSAFRETCELSAGLRAGSMQMRRPRDAAPMPGRAMQSKARKKGQLTQLGAAWTGRKRAVVLSYLSLKIPLKHDKEFSLVFAGAEVLERRGRMEIERSTVVLPDNGALLLAPPAVDAQDATLTLPPPFSGSASYKAQLGAVPVWSGSLQVHLPGAGAVPLTGKRFVAAFCQGSSAEEIERCMSPVAAEQKRFDG